MAQDLDQWKEKLQDTKEIINSSVKESLRYFGLEEELKDKELSVLLTGDDHIAELNEELRGHSRPTNVLSFPHMDFINGVPEDDITSEVFGEIIISYETLLKEAQEQGKEFNDHLAHLVVHSTMHLLGFDHIDEAEADKMENIEIEILSKLGISNPYL